MLGAFREFQSHLVQPFVYFSFSMKWLFVFLCLGIAAQAVEIGDTYDQVIAERGQPKSQMVAGQKRILTYSDGSIQLQDNVVVSFKLTNPSSPKQTSKPRDAVPPKQPPASAAEPASPKQIRPSQQEIAALRNKQLSAINRVKAIVNQPVKSFRRTDKMKVSIVQPGWFPEGAVTPDFKKVDVRSTQETTYDRFEYVTSDLNPDVAFRGRDIEFNAMTKYFYADRALPKKRLTQAEMQEINRLYRVIGECEQQLRAAEEL
jgi:hypothetical protein